MLHISRVKLVVASVLFCYQTYIVQWVKTSLISLFWYFLKHNFLFICMVWQKRCIVKFSVTAKYISMPVVQQLSITGHMLTLHSSLTTAHTITSWSWRTALFWITTQWVVVISYRHFRTTCCSHLQGSSTHIYIYIYKKVKVIPQQAEVAHEVPGRLRTRIFLTFGTGRL